MRRRTGRLGVDGQIAMRPTSGAPDVLLALKINVPFDHMNSCILRPWSFELADVQIPFSLAGNIWGCMDQTRICPNCGGRLRVVIVLNNGTRVWECRSCGHVVLENQPQGSR